MTETKEPSTRVLREIEHKLKSLAYPAPGAVKAGLTVAAAQIRAAYEYLEHHGPQQAPEGQPLEVKLSDIRTESGEVVVGWDHVDIDDGCRLFYKPQIRKGKTGFGFEFYAAEWTGGGEFEKGASWFENDPAEIDVECIWHGTACFDGVRHLYSGDEQTDNEGYFNYPKHSRIAGVLAEITKLEKKFCNDPPEEA